MKLVMLKHQDRELVALAAEHGYVPVNEVNRITGGDYAASLESLLRRGQWPELRQWYESGGSALLGRLPAIPREAAAYAPLLRSPGKLLGIGMNYAEKLEELQGDPAERDPLVFLKPGTALTGHGAPIRLPADAGAVTAEAELAIVIGALCKNVPEAEAGHAAAGYAAALDMTAADILKGQPRHLARAKGYDTFLSLGSELRTEDELPASSLLEVSTVLNGQVQASNTAGNMRYSPAFLISYLSRIMTLEPGDVILTGTPGSVTIHNRDEAECRITGFLPLTNPVTGPAR